MTETPTLIRIIRDAEATNISGLGPSRRRELEAQGKFPRRVRISDRATGYRSDELMAWVESRPRADEASPDVDVTTHATVDTRRKGAKVRNERARERQEREATGAGAQTE